MTHTLTLNDFAAVSWQRSSYSAANNECVELAAVDGRWVAMRDSKQLDGAPLAFAPGALAAFLASVKASDA